MPKVSVEPPISFKTKISKITSILAISTLIFSSLSAPTFAAETKTIDFSGYTWTVKSGFNGPGPNNWDDSSSSVFLDDTNQLHMKVSKIADQWYSSEVYLPSSLGYGTYEWETPSRVDKIDTNLVLGLLMYQDDTHEIDIEFSQWAVQSEENILNYTVQPYTTTGNTQSYPLVLTEGTSTHKIEWTKDYILFSSWQNGQKIGERNYTGADNFVPGEEKVHMNFWMIKGTTPFTDTDQEIVIKSFKFTPVSVTPTTEPTPAPTITPTTEPTPSTTITTPNKGNSKNRKFNKKRIEEIIRKFKEKIRKQKR